MTFRTQWAVFGLALILSFGLALRAALDVLPFGSWPVLPFDANLMDVKQIILAYAVLPRAAVALLAGAALGLSGALFQQVLRNPIADPSTLGVSAGAQLAIVIATLFFPAVLDLHRELIALSGAGVATALVFALGARRSFEPVTMIICGLLIGITAGGLSAAFTLSQGKYLMSLVTWNGGSLSQQDWSVAFSLSIQLIVGTVLAVVLSRPLQVTSIGDAGARSLGISLGWLRAGATLVATVLAAGVAASVGLISFVGLAAPAFVRAAGVRQPMAVLLASPLVGALLLSMCDGLVQLVASGSDNTFPTGAATALIGGPLLLWLLPKVRPMALADDAAPVSQRRSWRGLLVLLALLPIVAFLGLGIARTAQNWVLLWGADFNDLWPLRWPRLVAAAASGSLLAMAGTLLQRLTANPMASPEVLGVSGGAGIGFAAVVTLFPTPNALQLLAGAGCGALVALSASVVYASKARLAPERLLLAGIAISSLASAFLSALLAIGDQRSWQILNWIGGSASSATAGQAGFLSTLALVVLGLGIACSRWLGIMPLGQPVSLALGLPLRFVRVNLIVTAGLATGASSILVGPLSFIGLMAPHIALRAGFTTARDQLIAACLLGAALMAIADFGARTVTFPYELPLGLFAALIGAPYLVWVLAKR